MQGVSGSMIREILKLCNDPNMISFGGGNPSSDSFPVAEIKDIAQKGLTDLPIQMLQYGVSDGYAPFCQTLRTNLTAKGMSLENDHIMVVSGSQQSADLTAKILLNEGDEVICETPSFVGCLNAFRSYGAKLIGVPMESDGMNIELLEKALKENKNIRLIYTIPSFQNPTGFTTSLEKREAIYRLAQQYDVLIFEDNPYGELRFSGKDVPTIKSMDNDGRVIYAGSFSKVMAPAFRIGFMAFNTGLQQKMVVAKQCTDVHTTVLFQYICNEYMNEYDFDGHILRIKEIYRKKADLMLSEMEIHFHKDVTFLRPDGGLFVMAFLPEGLDATPFVKEGIARGVATVPSAAFSVNSTDACNGFRINFSAPSDEDIKKGVKILGKLTHEWLNTDPSLKSN